jgi:hypothetical protein
MLVPEKGFILAGMDMMVDTCILIIFKIFFSNSFGR